MNTRPKSQDPSANQGKKAHDKRAEIKSKSRSEKRRETEFEELNDDLMWAFGELEKFHGKTLFAEADEKTPLSSLREEEENLTREVRQRERQLEEVIIRAVHRDNRFLFDPELPVAKKNRSYIWFRALRGKDFLRKLHRGLEKKIKRPISIQDREFWYEVSIRRCKGQSYAHMHRALCKLKKFSGSYSQFYKKVKKLEESCRGILPPDALFILEKEGNTLKINDFFYIVQLIFVYPPEK